MPLRPRIHNPFPKVVRTHQARELDQRETDRHAERFNAHQRGYTREWRKVSRAFLQANPMCSGFDSRCEERGKRTPATEVDHTIPHRGSMRVFWDQSNWQALCHSCHSSKTAREDGGFGRRVTPARERRRAPVTIDGTASPVHEGHARRIQATNDRNRKILI